MWCFALGLWLIYLIYFTYKKKDYWALKRSPIWWPHPKPKLGKNPSNPCTYYILYCQTHIGITEESYTIFLCMVNYEFPFIFLLHSKDRNSCKGCTLRSHGGIGMSIQPPVSLRTLRLEIVTWPHTVRGMGRRWCGGRASLFWVRGTTSMEHAQDNKEFRDWWCINVTFSLAKVQNNYFIDNTCFRHCEVWLCVLLSIKFVSCTGSLPIRLWRTTSYGTERKFWTAKNYSDNSVVYACYWFHLISFNMIILCN